MGRRAPVRVQAASIAQWGHPARDHRRLAARALPLLALAIIALLVLAGCGDEQPYSHVNPRTEKASDIQWLYKVTFWAALVVFVGVQAVIVYTALRFVRRSDERPEQVHGNRRLELAWTIIPAVVLLVIFIPTAQVIYDHAAAEEDADFVVDVYGKQWWWEIHYPQYEGANPNNPEEPLVTANEVRLPQGADVVFNLYSNNVIHSFWVPQLSGKTDVIPGHGNKLQFTADTPGEYFGECAEFCGAAHAWMRFKVIVQPREEFDAWVAAWRQPPPVDANPQTADVVEAPPAFGACIACHNISGTNAQLARSGLGADPKSEGAGPNLTLLACRDVIAAGLLENNRENLVTWLMHTDEVKEGVYMPNYVENGSITPEQAEELADYLMQLQPAGGCPPDQPVGGDIPQVEIED